MPHAAGQMINIIHRFLGWPSAFQANPLIVRHWERASELLAFFCFAIAGTLYFTTARVLQAQRKRETNYPRPQMKCALVDIIECDAQHLDWTAPRAVSEANKISRKNYA